LTTYSSGAHIGSYCLIGPYPGGGYRAVHVTTHDRAMIDVRDLCDDWRDRAVQMLRATTLLGELCHPGIARILDRGVLPDRRPWVASELGEGVVLSEILARRTLAVDETVALVRDLAAIAMHAHARHLVHGAIHPHAIVVRTGECAFPIQLGAWSEVRGAGTDSDDAVPLTPYAAPESHPDGKADIYSIGVLAYRALTGRYPARQVDLVAGVPGPVGSLVVSMLAHDPTARPDAAAIHAVAVELGGVLTGPRFARAGHRWTPSPEAQLHLAEMAAAAVARARRG
jgi:serine/threonine protein kinase